MPRRDCDAHNEAKATTRGLTHAACLVQTLRTAGRPLPASILCHAMKSRVPVREHLYDLLRTLVASGEVVETHSEAGGVTLYTVPESHEGQPGHG